MFDETFQRAPSSPPPSFLKLHHCAALWTSTIVAPCVKGRETTQQSSRGLHAPSPYYNTHYDVKLPYGLFCCITHLLVRYLPPCESPFRETTLRPANQKSLHGCSDSALKRRISSESLSTSRAYHLLQLRAAQHSASTINANPFEDLCRGHFRPSHSPRFAQYTGYRRLCSAVARRCVGWNQRSQESDDVRSLRRRLRTSVRGTTAVLTSPL
jgi:hypothetical protein